MKLNWGKGILLAFLLFMAFILYFVVKAQTDAAYDNEMVMEDYYKKEQLFEEEYAKQNRAKALAQPVVCNTSSEGIIITFPSAFEDKNIKGKLFLYRPSNQKLDFEVPLQVSGSRLLIPNKNLVSGRWNIQVDWQYQNITYLNKFNIVY